MRLKELRKAEGLTQTDVTNELKTTRQNIHSYEANKTEPRIDTLIKLADYFDMSVDYLIEHEKTPNHGNGQTFG
ncbi:helix-turn-helix transcriptional regulator [Weissella bombi]|uniref:helix-turn-helix transcriptional regulator n=1 Tax=Weissella bombi TaxID=1505725 RepID=UPI003AF283E6